MNTLRHDGLAGPEVVAYRPANREGRPPSGAQRASPPQSSPGVPWCRKEAHHAN
jgi:hypothetical protein